MSTRFEPDWGVGEFAFRAVPSPGRPATVVVVGGDKQGAAAVPHWSWKVWGHREQHGVYAALVELRKAGDLTNGCGEPLKDLFYARDHPRSVDFFSGFPGELAAGLWMVEFELPAGPCWLDYRGVLYNPAGWEGRAGVRHPLLARHMLLYWTGKVLLSFGVDAEYQLREDLKNWFNLRGKLPVAAWRERESELIEGYEDRGWVLEARFLGAAPREGLRPREDIWSLAGA